MVVGENLVLLLIGAVVLIPAIIALIVWAGMLRKLSMLRKSLAEESDDEMIAGCYEREIHADLLDLVKSTKGKMVNGFVLGILALVLWYLLGTVSEQRLACETMRLLCLLALMMWALVHVTTVRLRMTAKRSVPVVQKLKTALETEGFLHVVVIALSGILYWIATL